MRGDSPAADGRERRVREAVNDAAVGRDDLYVDITELGGLGPVSVEGDRATVTVTVPVPATDVRARVEDELRTTVLGVEGVTDVAVEWRQDVADDGTQVERLPDVKNLVAVSSGKGGVGKSTVAANLAATLADAGMDVGLLDADVYGPNAPAMLGCTDSTPATTAGDEIVPREARGVSVMSMDFIVGEDDPVIWRGPMVDDVLKQLTADVTWGELDYLVVDLPPGTGDAQLTLVQHLPVTGAVVVTTPQPVAVDDARRGLQQFARYDVPILGVVENMHSFRCPDCGGTHDIFGEGGGDDLEAEFEVPVLARIPLDPTVGAGDHDEGDDDRGVSLPLVGRFSLPRTSEERAGGDDVSAMPGPDARDATRASVDQLATGVAARVAHLVESSE
jgi:ATP-binding protein involved in chromosome partitioning